MAEGPLVHYYANRLQKVLEEKEVRIEFGLRKLRHLSPLFEEPISKESRRTASSCASTSKISESF